MLLAVLDKMLFNQIREKDNLVYSISSAKYFDEKVPKEMTSYYIYYTADPINVELINSKIKELLENIQNKKFDQKIFEEQKIALKKDFDAGLKTNSFWLSSILNAAKYNQNIEKLTYLNSIIDSITLREITKLAKQLFDENYFENVDFIAE